MKSEADMVANIIMQTCQAPSSRYTAYWIEGLLWQKTRRATNEAPNLPAGIGMSEWISNPCFELAKAYVECHK